MTADTAPRVSVIMALHNGLPWLHDQLGALSQERLDEPWELVVADNQSTDGSAPALLEYADRLPMLRVVDAIGGRGPSFARNHAVAASRGQLLLFVDQDDQVAPGYLQAMVTALADHQLVAARVDHDALNPPAFVGGRSRWQSDGLMQTTFLPCASGCTLGMHRAVFIDVGGFDVELLSAQDIDFCWRAQLRGHALRFAPDAVLRYRYRTSLREHFAQERRWGDDDVLMYRRYRPAGMPRRALRAGVNDWRALLRRAATARTEADVAWCAGSLGRRIGRLRTSARLRVPYL